MTKQATYTEAVYQEYHGEHIEPLRRCDEIVRCRECTKSEVWQGSTLCHKFSMSSHAGWPVEPDGFCAWGERRDKE